jgi:hypothetical protein
VRATVGFLLLVLGFAAVGVFNAFRRARRREGLESLAEQLGLEFTALTLGRPEKSGGGPKMGSGVGSFCWLSPSCIAGISRDASAA